MAISRQVTYIYSVVAAGRRPTIRRALRGLPGMGAVRLLDVDRGVWLVVSDAPLERYGEDAINSRLSNINWVSRAAVAHEAVVESFIGARAVLPMKLFTIFSSDARALDFVRQDRRRIDALLERVANHLEWGVRVLLDRARAVSGSRTAAKAPRRTDGGVAYLTKKKAQRDTVVELAAHARETVGALYDRLAARARFARRRTASELPVRTGPLLLDAAFLVPRSRSAAFRGLVARQARVLRRQGYGVTLTGPWPPYTFIQD
jgi:gas vesicle protein GvpL/GvpF